MKKIFLIYVCVITFSVSLQCAEIDNNNLFSVPSKTTSFIHAPIEAYPDDLGYIPVEDVLNKIPVIPDTIQHNIDALLVQHPEIKTWCTLPKFKNMQEFILFDATQKELAKKMGNMSKSNITLFISGEKTSVIKIANINNRLRSIFSSLGYDPYAPSTTQNPEIIKAALNFNGPTIQHTSIPIGQYLIAQLKKVTATRLAEFKNVPDVILAQLREQFDLSDTIEYLPTGLYHLPGQSDELSDDHYLAWQGAIPENYQQFSELTTSAKENFIAKLKVKKFHKVLAYLHLAFPSEENLFVDTNTYKVVLPDTEKPNNEGPDPKAKWKLTQLGQDEKKAEHNINVGYDTFTEIIKKYDRAHDDGIQKQLVAWHQERQEYQERIAAWHEKQKELAKNKK